MSRSVILRPIRKSFRALSPPTLKAPPEIAAPASTTATFGSRLGRAGSLFRISVRPTARMPPDAAAPLEYSAARRAAGNPHECAEVGAGLALDAARYGSGSEVVRRRTAFPPLGYGNRAIKSSAKPGSADNRERPRTPDGARSRPREPMLRCVGS